MHSYIYIFPFFSVRKRGGGKSCARWYAQRGASAAEVETEAALPPGKTSPRSKKVEESAAAEREVTSTSAPRSANSDRPPGPGEFALSGGIAHMRRWLPGPDQN